MGAPWGDHLLSARELTRKMREEQRQYEILERSWAEKRAQEEAEERRKRQAEIRKQEAEAAKAKAEAERAVAEARKAQAEARIAEAFAKYEEVRARKAGASHQPDK